MKTPKHVPPDYQRPAYVSVLYLASVLGILGGLLLAVLALADGEVPWFAIGLVLAGCAHYLYAEIAEDIAHTAWQVRRTAWDLRVVIAEAAAAAEERLRLERERERQLREDVERRLAAARGEPPENDTP